MRTPQTKPRWWLRASTIATFGIAASVLGAAAPVLLRQRVAAQNASFVTGRLADDIAEAFEDEIDVLRAIAATVPELAPDPAVIDDRLASVTVPSKHAFFDDALIIATLGPEADTGPSLAVRVARNADGTGLRFIGLSAGARVSNLLAAAKLAPLPRSSDGPRLTWLRGDELADEVVGAVEAGTANTVIADTFPVLVMPVPGRGWVLAIAKPAGVDLAARQLEEGETIAVSLHSGAGETGPLLAERRALQPPPTSNVRRHERTFRILQEPLTVIVGADRFFGTRPGSPPLVILFVGSLITLLASATVSVRTQRRARRAMQVALDRERLLARTDPLTGLGNRLAFNEAMDAELARSGPLFRPVAVLLCDLDRFKVINDARGHEVGDHLLCDVGTRMRVVASEAVLQHKTSDLDESRNAGVSGVGTAEVYRFGGDEFVIALTGSAAQGAVDFAYGLVAAVRKPFRVGVDQVVIGVSIGLATRTGGDQGHTRSVLLRDADMAMYVAKRSGGNRVAVADDSVRTAGTNQLDLEIELRNALGSGQLRAWYQPLVNQEREVVALEALIRWQHPTRGLRSPGTFLPAAKCAGLLAELSTVVLAEAARDVADWNRRRCSAGLPPLVVHVNCVEEQLMDTGFADAVGSYLCESGLDPHCMLLEISEETALDRLPASLPTLDLLRSSGVRFSIDDFGFGNSSLTMVRRVGEVAELKIDKSIIDGLTLGSPIAADVAVIRSIVEFCATQKITVVAEGIEEEHQFSQLVGLGVELYQGYLFHRPQPADALDAILVPSSEIMVS